MRRAGFAAAVIVGSAAVVWIAAIVFSPGAKNTATASPSPSPSSSTNPSASGQPEDVMKLTSTAFADSQAIPPKYTCAGDNINPPLTIQEVPSEAKSLALVVDDPDAPGGTFDHWLAWNIAAGTAQIAERTVPAGAVQGSNGSGEVGYMGPCPPSGKHRYNFKLYALDRSLELTEGAGKADLEAAMKDHIVAETQLVGTFAK